MKKYIWEGYDLRKVGRVSSSPGTRKVPETVTCLFLWNAFLWGSAPFGFIYWADVSISLHRGEPLSGYDRNLLTAIFTYGGRA